MMDEATALAALVGASPAEVRKALGFRELLSRIERARRPLQLLEVATNHLPAFARRLVAEEDKRPAVLAAIELGLVENDAPLEVSLAAMRDLGQADQYPTTEQVAKPRAGNKVAAVLAFCAPPGRTAAEIAGRFDYTSKGALVTLSAMVNRGELVFQDGRYVAAEQGGDE